MGEKILFLMVLVSISGLSMANWNIFNYGRKIVVDTSLKNYCESWRMNVELNNIKGFDVVPEECTEYIGKYMTSSQYKMDCETAVEECQLYLSSYCILKGDGKDAWIFDIDDTLLSTVPYFKKHNYGGEILDLDALEEWMQKAEAPEIKTIQEFYKQIKEKGFKIFLISARRESLRDATVDNLISVGYHGWSGLILRGVDDEDISVKSYKAKARAKLVDQGYRLWGIVGDQWSSFEESPCAKRTFKLPNSLYYVT